MIVNYLSSKNIEYLKNSLHLYQITDEKEKNKYINKMAMPSEWGTDAEIKAFAQLLKIEIAVVTKNYVQIFGIKEGYENRIFIFYDNNHFEPLVITYDNFTDPKYQTIFSTKDKETCNLFETYGKTFT
jgi:hypothetical protein